MKKILSLLGAALPHLILILSLMMLTFFVIDLVNPAMAFLNNTITKTLLAVFAVLAAVLSVWNILCGIGKERK